MERRWLTGLWCGRVLHQELYEYLDATIMVQTSPEEAYRKYDDLTNKHIEQLRKLTKAIQDARIARDNDAIKQVGKQSATVAKDRGRSTGC
jgi:tetratricopeptide repeat protein 30